MTQKAEIVERLGEKAVLLPALLGEALAANDRIKLRLSLLQDAAAAARDSAQGSRGLPIAQRQAGLAEPGLESLIGGARLLGPGRLFLPGVAILLRGLDSDLAAMLAPLAAAGSDTAGTLAERAAAVRRSLPAGEADEIDTRTIDALASARSGGGDTLHLLVMDLHKALNRLAAETAVESIDGAQVHALEDSDRGAVQAFMRGLHRTAALAFGHPGLGTTAVRAGGHLTIQNDIGTTDVHVIVIHVDAEQVSVTYTDLHRPRAKFFIALFDGKDVAWDQVAEQSAEGFSEDIFYLVTGRYGSADEAARLRFLEFLGSRIVFLIDWNKARKALQTFVGRSTAIELLTWAARSDFGHRAFLELGGVDLVFDAVHRVAAGRIPYGVRLDEALGVAECSAFLQRVLRNTSQGLAAGRSPRLIRDEIQADLSRGFESAQSAVLTVLVRHLGLTRSLAGAIADALSSPGLMTSAKRQGLAMRGKRIEAKADTLTVAARELATRIREGGNLRRAIDEIENATDALEDCTYLLGLVPAESETAFALPALLRLAEITVDSVGDLVRAVEATSRLPEGLRTDATRALQAIDAVVTGERSADAAERDTLAALMASPRSDARLLVLGLEIARALETATDHLSHAALSLRDRVLEELST